MLRELVAEQLGQRISPDLDRWHPRICEVVKLQIILIFTAEQIHNSPSRNAAEKCPQRAAFKVIPARILDQKDKCLVSNILGGGSVVGHTESKPIYGIAMTLIDLGKGCFI